MIAVGYLMNNNRRRSTDTHLRRIPPRGSHIGQRCRHLVWRGLSRGRSLEPARRSSDREVRAPRAVNGSITDGLGGLPVCQSGRQRPVTRTSHDLGIPTRRRRRGDGRVEKIVGRVVSQ